MIPSLFAWMPSRARRQRHPEGEARLGFIRGNIQRASLCPRNLVRNVEPKPQTLQALTVLASLERLEHAGDYGFRDRRPGVRDGDGEKLVTLRAPRRDDRSHFDPVSQRFSTPWP
jgi:hypothetical protein